MSFLFLTLPPLTPSAEPNLQPLTCKMVFLATSTLIMLLFFHRPLNKCHYWKTLPFSLCCCRCCQMYCVRAVIELLLRDPKLTSFEKKDCIYISLPPCISVIGHSLVNYIQPTMLFSFNFQIQKAAFTKKALLVTGSCYSAHPAVSKRLLTHSIWQILFNNMVFLHWLFSTLISSEIWKK